MKKDKIKIDSSSFIDKESKLSGNITIGKNCRIENCVLKDVVIKDNTIIKFSDIDGAKIGENVSIGPYARIRPFSVLEDKVHIGNFVEIKNSYIKKGSKVPHLSYVGDATIGENCNIGCGVIFCNYDGQNKTHSFGYIYRIIKTGVFLIAIALVFSIGLKINTLTKLNIK